MLFLNLVYGCCIDSGLVPDEDAPDIIANTFLAEVTQEQLDAIGLGFLQHRECKLIVTVLTGLLRG